MNTFASLEVALRRAVDNNFTAFDIGVHAALRTHRHASFRKPDLAVRLAIDKQVGSSGDFTVNLET